MANALYDLSWNPATAQHHVLYYVARGSLDRCVQYGLVAFDPLIERLEDCHSSDQQEQAAKALGLLGDKRAVEALIVAATSYWRPLREAAAEALGELRDPLATNSLIQMIKDPERSASLVAIRALGKLGDPRAVPALMAALKSSLDRKRMSAAVALGIIADQRAVEPLIAALHDSDYSVREVAARALGQLGNPQAIESLAALLLENVEHDWRGLGRRDGIVCAYESLLAILRNSAIEYLMK